MRVRKWGTPLVGAVVAAGALGCASAGSQAPIALSAQRTSAACPAGRFHASGSPGSGYPAPSVSASCSGSTVTVQTNDIPDYKFVPITPNALRAVPATVTFPRRPTVAGQVTEVPPLGMEAIAVDGVLIATPEEAAFPASQAYGDPVYNYALDRCMGHMGGNFHYHALVAGCFGASSRGPSPILGYAFDGFPIYGPRGCLDRACHHVVTFRSSYERIAGRTPQMNAAQAFRYVAHHSPQYLDRCNGRVGPDGTYRYYATYTYPHVIGCYRGTPSGGMQINGQGGPPSGGAQPAGYGCTLTSAGKVVCRQQGRPQ
jgi:hypothetical protein